MIVLFSVRSVLCPVYMYCVCIDIACPHFFVHVRLRSFGSMTPPVYSDHSCPVSHHLVLFPFEFRFVCFVSRLHVQYCVLYLAFLHVVIFFLFAVLPGFCLSVLAMYFVLSSTLQTPPFLLNWYQKTKFTSLRQYHFICICEGGGGRGQGGPWPMGDSGSCSGVLKYAVT